MYMHFDLENDDMESSKRCSTLILLIFILKFRYLDIFDFFLGLSMQKNPLPNLIDSSSETQGQIMGWEEVNQDNLLRSRVQNLPPAHYLPLVSEDVIE